VYGKRIVTQKCLIYSRDFWMITNRILGRLRWIVFEWKQHRQKPKREILKRNQANWLEINRSQRKPRWNSLNLKNWEFTRKAQWISNLQRANVALNIYSAFRITSTTPSEVPIWIHEKGFALDLWTDSLRINILNLRFSILASLVRDAKD